MDLKTQIEEAFLYLVNYYSWFRPADEEIAIGVWCDALEDVPPESIYPAVKHWCKHNSKEPCAADIRRIILAASCRKKAPLAHVAWDELVRAAEEGLSWHRVSQRFRKYPNVVKAAHSVGWQRIRCADTLTELPYVRKDFIAAYQDIKADAEERSIFSDQEKELFKQIFTEQEKQKLLN